MKNAINHPVPICATVSRKTGKVRIEWSESKEEQIRFGSVMNRINVTAARFADETAKAAYQGGKRARGVNALASGAIPDALPQT